MLYCNYCNKEIEQGQICTNCKTILCNTCATTNKCKYCGQNHIEISVDSGRIDQIPVQWIKTGNYKFGLNGFKSFPVIAFQLLKYLPIIQGYNIILLPSKERSNILTDKLKSNNSKVLPIGFLSTAAKNSRYSIMVNQSQNETLVFLNSSSTTESALHFLIIYFNKNLEFSKQIPVINPSGLATISTYLTQALMKYNLKYGINFVNFDEYLQSLSFHMFGKLRANYIEVLTVKSLAEHQELAGELSPFVLYKIETVFSLATPLKIYTLMDTINFWGNQMDAFSLVHPLSNNEQLYLTAKNTFKRSNDRILSRLSKKSRLKSLYIDHVQELETQNYTNLEEYLHETGRCLVNFIGNLDPEFDWLEEIGVICEAAEWYTNQSDHIQFSHNPQFGTIEEFIEIISRIFYKKKSNPNMSPELPLQSGYILYLQLENLMKLDSNPKYYQQLKTIGTDLVGLLEECNTEIKKRNPTSILCDHKYAALILTSLFKLAWNEQDYEVALYYLSQADSIADKNKLTEISAQVLWTKFLVFNDYEALLQGYRTFSAVKGDDYEMARAQFRLYLASGVFEEKNKFEHYKKAISVSGFPISGDTTHSSEDLKDEHISFYLSNLFFHVEKALEQNTLEKIAAELAIAKPYALALETEMNSVKSPENVFAWKTLLILTLINDKNRAKEYCRKIEEYPVKCPTNERVTKKAREQIEICETMGLNASMNAIEVPFEKRDPWSRLLQKVVEIEFKDLLERQLKFFSRAILFVEGPTENVFLPVLCDKLGFNLKKLGIGIIPMGGSTKKEYHLRLWKEIIGTVKTLTKNNTLPIYIIFDQNAIKDAEEAISEGLVLRNNCFVLKMGDIEDYYPDKILIEVIKNVSGLTPLSSDLSGRKAVAIDHFLKKNRFMIDWKITVGEKVGNLMKKNDISLEIQEILSTIIERSK